MQKFIRIIRVLLIIIGIVISVVVLFGGFILLPLAILMTTLLFYKPVWLRITGSDGSRKRLGWTARWAGLLIIFFALLTRHPATETESKLLQKPATTTHEQVARASVAAPSPKPELTLPIDDLVKDVRVAGQVKGVKITIHATLSRRLSGEELQAVMNQMIQPLKEAYENSFIMLFLENQSEAWASAQYAGGQRRGLQHAILADDVARWRSMPRPLCDRLIGEWLDEEIGDQSRRTICIRRGKPVCLHERPGQNSIEVPLKRLSNKRFQTMDGDGFIYVIYPSGHLQVLTSEGQAWTGKMRPFAESLN